MNQASLFEESPIEKYHRDAKESGVDPNQSQDPPYFVKCIIGDAIILLFCDDDSINEIIRDIDDWRPIKLNAKWMEYAKIMWQAFLLPSDDAWNLLNNYYDNEVQE